MVTVKNAIPDQTIKVTDPEVVLDLSAGGLDVFDDGGNGPLVLAVVSIRPPGLNARFVAAESLEIEPLIEGQPVVKISATDTASNVVETEFNVDITAPLGYSAAIMRHLKDYPFDASTRKSTAFSDTTKIHINTDESQFTTASRFRGALQLKSNQGKYSTDMNISASSDLTNPTAIQAWLGLQEIAEKPIGTSVGYRVTDGSDQFHWDGSDWVLSAVDWNTIAELNEGIRRFIPQKLKKTIGFIINLATTDEDATPKLFELRLIGAYDADVFDDLVYRSVVPALKSAITYTDKVVIIEADPETNTLLVSDFDFGTSTYKVIDVISVYDEEGDEAHFNNLLESFDAETGVITLIAPVAKDTPLRLKLTYRPRVEVQANQDIIEVAEQPVILIERIQEQNSKKIIARDHIADVGGGAFGFSDPIISDYMFTLRIVAGYGVDLKRLDSAVKELLRTGLIASTGLDEQRDVTLLPEFATGTQPNLSDAHVASTAFIVRNVSNWDFRGQVSLVDKLNVTVANVN